MKSPRDLNKIVSYQLHNILREIHKCVAQTRIYHFSVLIKFLKLYFLYCVGTFSAINNAFGNESFTCQAVCFCWVEINKMKADIQKWKREGRNRIKRWEGKEASRRVFRCFRQGRLATSKIYNYTQISHTLLFFNMSKEKDAEEAGNAVFF